MPEIKTPRENTINIPELCGKHGLGSFAEKIESVIKPATVINLHRSSMDEMAMGESRFGGIPDLPMSSEGSLWQGTYWPEHDGKPLDFYAQFDLKQLQSYKACSQLPNEGYLLFFEGDHFTPRVLYTTEVSDLHRPSEAWEQPQVKKFQACKLTFRDSWKLPHPGSSAIQSIGMNQEVIDRYDALYRDWRNIIYLGNWENSWLFGYPDIFNCPENPDWEPPNKIAEERGKEGWQLLLQIGDNDTAEMRIGDLGLLSFWIHEKDLASWDFSRCWTAMEGT